MLQYYVQLCDSKGFNLNLSYAFGLLDSHQKLSSKPLSSSAANARLKLYLTNINLWEVETPHSTRSGCALTLAWLGINKDAIKLHVGWKSDSMLRQYTLGNEMCSKFTSAEAIGTKNNSSLQSIFERFKDFSKFKNRTD